MSAHLPDSARRVLETIDGEMDVAEISRRTTLCVRTVRYGVKKLVALGMLKRKIRMASDMRRVIYARV